MTTGRNKGLIQILPKSKSYEEMYHIKNFKLNNYFALNCGLSEDDVFQNFMTSLIGYSVSNYIFGITQRNKRNINFQKDAQVFCTSYEHLLNHYSKLYGDRGEPFYISKYFIEYFGGQKGKKMEIFQKKIGRGKKYARGLRKRRGAAIKKARGEPSRTGTAPRA